MADNKRPHSKYLTDRRKELGLSQQALADLSGLHITQVQKLEYGLIKPENLSLKNGLALAKALEIDPSDLLRVGGGSNDHKEVDETP